MLRTLIALILLTLAFNTSAVAGSKNVLGEKIYKGSCATCHTNGVAQAPKAHDQAAWQARFKQALGTVKKHNPNLSVKEQQAKALTILMSHVKNGMGVMPKGGLCNHCSDKDYKAAIEFMMQKKI